MEKQKDRDRTLDGLKRYASVKNTSDRHIVIPSSLNRRDRSPSRSPDRSLDRTPGRSLERTQGRSPTKDKSPKLHRNQRSEVTLPDNLVLPALEGAVGIHK